MKQWIRVAAFRGGHKWVQQFDQVRLGRAAEDPLPLKEQGVYLITGGVGGVVWPLPSLWRVVAAPNSFYLFGHSFPLERVGTAGWLNMASMTLPVQRFGGYGNLRKWVLTLWLPQPMLP